MEDRQNYIQQPQQRLAAENASLDSPVTGGDLDADTYQADVVGEEAVGGMTPVPGQNDVDKLGKSLGIELDDREEVSIKEKLEKRDNQALRLNEDFNRI